MNVRIIIPLRNFQLDDYPAYFGPYKIVPGVFLGLKELVTFENLRQNLGKIHIDKTEACVVLYYEGDIKEIQGIKETYPAGLMAAELADLFTFIFGLLWQVKDNSVFIKDTYVEILKTKSVGMNTRDLLASNSKGKFTSVTFSKEDLVTISKLGEKLYPLTSVKVSDLPKDPRSDISEAGILPTWIGAVPYEFTRIQRAYLFLDFARSNSVHFVKITFYIAMYECLFTSSNSEVTYQVSERAALFLGGDHETQTKNFELIKSAYNIRSRYIHGDSIKKPIEYLQSICTPLDELTRILMNKVLGKSDIFLLTDSDGDKKKFEDYFRKLIFK